MRRRGMRAAMGVVGLVLVGATLTACGQSLDEIAPEVGMTEVSVEDNRFGPRVIKVAPGTEVTWVWDGRADHNVVGNDFESRIQDEGEFSYVFAEAGTFNYLCTLHGGMTGRVIVQ